MYLDTVNHSYKEIKKIMEQKIIQVTGRGFVHIVPDVTRLELKLISLHDSYQEAYEQTKNDTEKLNTIMEAAGLNKNLAKTVRLDIDKKTINQYDKYKNYIGEKFLGFQLDHIVKINLNMDTVVLNKLVKGIGEELKQAEINIGYSVKDNRPIQLLLLERAVKDAKEKAQIMAKAAGCKLGSCLHIDYGIEELHLYEQARSIHDADEACYCNKEALDITPEDWLTSDTVETQWLLED